MSSQFRIAICRIFHGSNSFSTFETDLTHFKNVSGILVGNDVLEKLDRNDEVTGFLNTIKTSEENIEVIPLLSVFGLAGGNVSTETVRSIEETLRQELSKSGCLDGMLFAFEGAMASAEITDLEGHFLHIARQEKGEAIPIICALNCHAIVTREMVNLSSAIVAYRTHPHVDRAETGKRAANILLRMLADKIKPVMTWQKIPMIVPMPDDGTNSGPLKELFDHLKTFDEIDGVVDCSLFFSHCFLDVPEQGWAVLAVTDSAPELGRRLVQELAMKAWNARKSLLPEKMLLPEEAVRAAASVQGHPIIITDSADTVGAGAPGDTTELLGELLAQRETVDGLILFHLPDEEAVKKITPDDVGSTVTLEVGGKRDNRFSRPLTVTGKVLAVTDGIIEDVGKFGTNRFVDAGKTVCLGIDNVRLVLTERIVFGPQPSLFRKVGIEPFDAKIVGLKTGIGFKVTYDHVAKAVFRADCPGAASYNLKNYDWSKVERPLYPLDPDMHWLADL